MVLKTEEVSGVTGSGWNGVGFCCLTTAAQRPCTLCLSAIFVTGRMRMYRQVIGVPQELLKKERKKKRVPQDKRARLPPLRFKKKKKVHVCTED